MKNKNAKELAEPAANKTPLSIIARTRTGETISMVPRTGGGLLLEIADGCGFTEASLTERELADLIDALFSFLPPRRIEGSEP